jgi:5-formyltetrahydrofolate cyclo-ligase
MNGISQIQSKKALRILIKERKSQLSKEERNRFSEEIMHKIEQCEAFRTAQSVLCYWSLPDEVQTIAFIERHRFDKRIYLPVIVENYLKLRLFEGKEQMQTGALGIAEPVGATYNGAIDLAIIPGVAFDDQGHRLGRGKGFYDRFLPSTQAYKIGITFRCQLVDNVPVDDLDIAMDEVVTE